MKAAARNENGLDSLREVRGTDTLTDRWRTSREGYELVPFFLLLLARRVILREFDMAKWKQVLQRWLSSWRFLGLYGRRIEPPGGITEAPREHLATRH
jgi:hypothetical protein